MKQTTILLLALTLVKEVYPGNLVVNLNFTFLFYPTKHCNMMHNLSHNQIKRGTLFNFVH